MRHYIYIALAALFALSFLSCNKGPKVVIDRYLVKYIPAGVDTAAYENGLVTDIEELYYTHDTIAIQDEYKRFESETEYLIKKSKEFDQTGKVDKSMQDSLSHYAKMLYECRCLMFITHDPAVDTQDFLNIVKENGADLKSDIKYAKENQIKLQVIELHNDVWLNLKRVR